MADQRLPTVNADDGAWGNILNQYLAKEHYNTGLDNIANGGHKTITVQPGTTAAGTAPLKFTSGDLLATAEVGAVEFNADKLYVTTSTPTRKTIAAYDASGATGDVHYQDSSGNFHNLAIGSSNQVLAVAGGLPQWETLTTTTTLYVDVNRVDTYTANGSISYPYKTISAAVTAGNALVMAYSLEIAAGTYTDASVSTIAYPCVIHGNQSTYTVGSGGGTLTLSNTFSIYGLNLVGNLAQTNTTQANFTAIQNCNIYGNLTLSGSFSTFQSHVFGNGSANSLITVNSTAMATFSNTILGTQTASCYARIVNSGYLLLLDTILYANDSTYYAVTSSAVGSTMSLSAFIVNNAGTGGGVNCANSATTLQNEIVNTEVFINGTTNGITCGTAYTYMDVIKVFNTNTGLAVLPTGSNIQSSYFGGINVLGNIGVDGYITSNSTASFTGIGSGLSYITIGNGTIGGVFQINDISGAKQAMGTAGWNLTFFKHRSTDDTYYQTFQIVSGSGTAIGATGYKFNIGATTPVNIDSSGRLNLGVETAAYITPAQLNLVASASGALVPGINLVNKGGGTGAGMSINFSTWDGTGTTEPGARIRSSDNAYSADLVFTTKIPGSATNALVDRYKILSGGGTQTFGTAQVYHLAGGTSAPTLATGTGSGTGGTITATLSTNTTDMAGQVNITTGTAPAASATVFTVTFNVAYGTAPIVILTPGNAITARLNNVNNVYVSASSTTTFTVTSNTTALTATTAYVWYYQVVQ